MNVIIDGHSLGIDSLFKVASNDSKIALNEESKTKISSCRTFIERKLDEGVRVYGTNTGVGEFSDVVLDRSQLQEFQKKLIYSHSAGIGKEMPIAWVRGAMAARVNVHAKGYSGCRLEITNTLVEMLNKGVTPRVSIRGSVGACGDLAPMAEIALLLLGEGHAYYMGELLDGKSAMEQAGIRVPNLECRDGLATINGSNFITAVSAIQAKQIKQLLRVAEVACAMSMEALNANVMCLDQRIHDVRGFSGSIESARFISRCLDGGDLKQGKIKTNLQDAYSIRSTPQVIGAAYNALWYSEEQITTELNGVGDNPIFCVDDDAVLTGANFQGSPVSLPMEMMGSAMTSVCVLSERRLNRLLDKQLSNGLPMFLIQNSGLNSGLMISQYTADALISEQRVLAGSAYVGSIPGAGSQEDYVSMGMTTVIKNQQILDNAYGVIAIELIAAAQALDLRNQSYGDLVERARSTIREHVDFLDEDRVLIHDHNRIASLIESGDLYRSIDEDAALSTAGNETADLSKVNSMPSKNIEAMEL